MSLADIADHFLVFAWTDAAKQKQRDHGGLSAFMVTREMKGITTSTIHGKLGIRAGNTGSIVMEDVRVPDDHRLGQEGEGFHIAMFALDQGRNTRETSLAKWYATVASEQAAGDAVEVHGAYGYSDEYPVERFYRNAKGAVIYEGTREIHTLLQADYALGLREDKPTRVTLPKWPFEQRDS